MLKHQAIKANSKTEANVSCVDGFEWSDSITASWRPEYISLSQARKRLRASFNMMTERKILTIVENLNSVIQSLVNHFTNEVKVNLYLCLNHEGVRGSGRIHIFFFAVAQTVEELCYKSEDRGFESR
jgi:hypothetical protein